MDVQIVVNTLKFCILFKIFVIILSDDVHYLNDECLALSNNTIYPRCVIHAIMTPKVRCVDGSNEITFVTSSSSLSGIVFECSAPYILDMDFDGIKPAESTLYFVPEWRNETDEAKYVAQYSRIGFKSDIVGKYTFFAINNKSMQTSFYIYYEDDSSLSRSSPSLMIFSDQRLLVAMKSKSEADEYILPCRPLSRATKITLWSEKEVNSYVQVSQDCASFNPQTGFTLKCRDTNLNSNCSDVCTKDRRMKCQADAVDNRNKKVSEDALISLEETEAESKKSGCEPRMVLNFTGSSADCFMENFRACDNFSPTIKLLNVKTNNPVESKLLRICHKTSKIDCLDFKKQKDGHYVQCPHGVDRDQTSCSRVDSVYSSGILFCYFQDVLLVKEYFLDLDGNIGTYLISQARYDTEYKFSKIKRFLPQFSIKFVYNINYPE